MTQDERRRLENYTETMASLSHFILVQYWKEAVVPALQKLTKQGDLVTASGNRSKQMS